jgi:hypothetical protein
LHPQNCWLNEGYGKKKTVQERCLEAVQQQCTHSKIKTTQFLTTKFMEMLSAYENEKKLASSKPTGNNSGKFLFYGQESGRHLETALQIIASSKQTVLARKKQVQRRSRAVKEDLTRRLAAESNVDEVEGIKKEEDETSQKDEPDNPKKVALASATKKEEEVAKAKKKRRFSWSNIEELEAENLKLRKEKFDHMQQNAVLALRLERDKFEFKKFMLLSKEGLLEQYQHFRAQNSEQEEEEEEK